MTPVEQGFLLLTGYLGDPYRKPLTTAQFRDLTLRVQKMERLGKNRQMTREDIVSLGYDARFADRVLTLLSHTQLLEQYLERGRQRDCFPVTRRSTDYPQRLRDCLNAEAPGVLWAKGDLRLLEKPKVALVGSRDLGEENLRFAWLVGKQAALQGYVLVSGNARGADREAQDACLAHGGKVISVVADKLDKHPVQKNVLYLSEEGFDLDFTARRALSRNRVIHSLGTKTFVAQSGLGKGGTWDGTRKNLQGGWSAVFCCKDGSPASLELANLGATLITDMDLYDIDTL